MPYIKSEDRPRYESGLDDLGFCFESSGYIAGHVTYVIFVMLARWWEWNKSYDTIAKIRGCLAGVLSELDRRYFFPYEDQKIQENGDVELEYQVNITECFCGQFNCEYHGEEEDACV